MHQRNVQSKASLAFSLASTATTITLCPLLAVDISALITITSSQINIGYSKSAPKTPNSANAQTQHV